MRPPPLTLEGLRQGYLPAAPVPPLRSPCDGPAESRRENSKPQWSVLGSRSCAAQSRPAPRPLPHLIPTTHPIRWVAVLQRVCIQPHWFTWAGWLGNGGAWCALTTTFPVSATEMTQALHSGQRNAQGAHPMRTACHAMASAPSTSHWSRPWEYRTDATRLTSTKLCIKGILPPFHTPRNSPASHGGTVKGRCRHWPAKDL